MNKLINRSMAVLGAAFCLMLSACGPASTAAPTNNPSPAAVSAAQASATPASTAPANTATVLPTQGAPIQAPSSAPSAMSAATGAPSVVPTAMSAATSAPAGLPNSEATPNGTIVATVAPPPPPSKNNIQGQPTRVVLPTLRVDSKVIPVGWTTVIQGNQLVSDWETADYAVGFHFTSAPPGTVGNTVMSGHNNINGAVFRDLDMLKVGDKITVYAGDKVFQYAVSQTMIVAEKFAGAEQQQKNAQWIAPTNDNRLTLISCWPRTNNTHRVIVVAKPA